MKLENCKKHFKYVFIYILIFFVCFNFLSFNKNLFSNQSDCIYAETLDVDVWDGTTIASSFSGEGSQANPYKISTGAELALLSQQVNNGESYAGKYFNITSDIDLNYKSWNSIGIIGNNIANSKAFSGSISGLVKNGKNVTIKNLYIQKELVQNDRATGLFGYICGTQTFVSVIKNIDILGVAIEVSGSYSANYYAGTLVGYASNCEIINCSAKSSKDISDTRPDIVSRISSLIWGGSFSYIGGIVGYFGEVGGKIEYATSSLTIMHINSVASRLVCGGILGQSSANSLYINRCYSERMLKILTEEDANNCELNFGGICGIASKISISNSYSTLNINDALEDDINYHYFGGIIGTLNECLNIDNEYTIQNCFFKGQIVSSSSTCIKGTLIGRKGTSNYEAKVSHFYVDADESVLLDYVGSLEGVVSGVDTSAFKLSTQEWKQQSSFKSGSEGFDFDSIWEITNGMFPTLQAFSQIIQPTSSYFPNSLSVNYSTNWKGIINTQLGGDENNLIISTIEKFEFISNISELASSVVFKGYIGATDSTGNNLIAPIEINNISDNYETFTSSTGEAVANIRVYLNQANKTIYFYSPTVVYSPENSSSIFSTYLVDTQILDENSVKYFTSLQSINFGNIFDTSKADKFNYMFAGCSNLEDLDLSGFLTTNATSIKELFKDCVKLETINLSSFNLENLIFEVKDAGLESEYKIGGAHDIFSGCTALKCVIGPSELNDDNINNISLPSINGTWYYSDTKVKVDTNSIDNKDQIYKIGYDILHKDKEDATFSGKHENNYIPINLFGESTTLDTPTKTGYNFLGYFINSDCSGSAITKVENIESSLTIYAKWEAKTFEIVFNSNGGIGSMSKQIATYDSSLALSENDYYYQGKVFKGWATSNSGNVVFKDKQTLTLTEINSIFENNLKNGQFNLYAVWNECKIILTIDSKESYFDDIALAIERVNQENAHNVKMQIVDNIVIESSIEIINNNINIEVVGNPNVILTVNQNVGIKYKGNKTLKLGLNLKLEDDNSNNYEFGGMIINQSTGKIIVDGAEIIGQRNYYTIYNGFTGEVIINNGKVYSSGYNLASNIYTDAGNVIINNGQFTALNEVTYNIFNNGTALITINNGTFNSYDTNIFNAYNGNVIIEGGSFISSNAYNIKNMESGSITLNNGNFSSSLQNIFNQESGMLIINGFYNFSSSNNVNIYLNNLPILSEVINLSSQQVKKNLIIELNSPEDNGCYIISNAAENLDIQLKNENWISRVHNSKLVAVKQFTISYDVNLGSSINPEKYTIIDETITLNTSTTRYAHEFENWKVIAVSQNSVKKGLNSFANINDNISQIYTGSFGNITVQAVWKNIGNILYTVKHYKMDLRGNYSLSPVVEEFYGIGNTQVEVPVKSYTGFIEPTPQKVLIKIDGSTVVNYYYERNTYSLTLSYNLPGVEGFYVNNNLYISSLSFYYETSIEIHVVINEKAYHWINWTKINNEEYSLEKDITFSIPANDIELTANLEINKYKITLTQTQNGSLSFLNSKNEVLSDQELIVDYGENIKILAVENEGYEFIAINIIGNGYTCDDLSKKETNIYNISSDLNISASFNMLMFNILINVNGPGKAIYMDNEIKDSYEDTFTYFDDVQIKVLIDEMCKIKELKLITENKSEDIYKLLNNNNELQLDYKENIEIYIEFDYIYWTDENIVAKSFSSGNGTQTSPFIITNAYELALMSNLINSATINNQIGLYYSDCYYKLAKNINLQGAYWNPIGVDSQNSRFNGVIDYDFYKINNATLVDKNVTVYFENVFKVYTENAQFLNRYKTNYVIIISLIVAFISAVLLVLILIWRKKNVNKRKKVFVLNHSNINVNNEKVSKVIAHKINEVEFKLKK